MSAAAITAEERSLAAWLDQVTEEELRPLAIAWGEQHRTPRALLARMAELGLFGLNIDEAYGGTGSAHRYSTLLCLIRETLGYHHPLVDFTFGVQGLGTVAIVTQGTEAQKQRFLPTLLDGSELFAFALTEPQSGSDVQGLRTRAERTPDGWSLSGRKTFISGAPDADVYCVLARTGEEIRGKAITAFLVDGASDGLHASQDLTLAAPHTIGSLDFAECVVPEDRVIGRVDGGLATAFGTLEIYRPSVGALGVGTTKRAFDLSLDVARTREAFGTTLLDLPAIRLKLAWMWRERLAARSLVYRAAAHRDAGRRSAVIAAMAKLRASESAHRAVYEAQQIHGGRGVLHGTEVEELARHTRQATIYEGTSEIQRSIIGRAEAHRAGSGTPLAIGDAPLPHAGGALVSAARAAHEEGLASAAGHPALRQQEVQFRLADAAVALTAAELLAADVTSEPDDVGFAASRSTALAAADAVASTFDDLARSGLPVGHVVAGLRGVISADACGSTDSLLLDLADLITT